MRDTKASSLYVISTHVTGLYSHVYCTIKGVEEGKKPVQVQDTNCYLRL